MLPLLSWYMGGVDHVHRLDLGREGFLASTVWPAGLLIVLAPRAFARVLGCELASLLYHPLVMVGVVGGLLRGAMNLARHIQDCIQFGVRPGCL